MKREQKKLKYLVFLSLLVSVAMILSYLESLIPPIVPIPGVKLGLANAATLFALYVLGIPEALGVSAIRILLSGILFGNPVSLIYSAAGGALSLLGSVLLKKSGFFSPIGVSAAAGVLHNVGQMIAVVLVLENAALASYVFPLILSGTVSGALVGVVSGMLIARLSAASEKFKSSSQR